MADADPSTTPLSSERIAALSDQLIGMLNAAIGFRNPQKASMLLVYMRGDGITDAHRRQLVQQVTERLSTLAPRDGENVAAGLAETRELIEAREPGLRTMGAVSLWEELVAALPLPLQHRARAGQLD